MAKLYNFTAEVRTICKEYPDATFETHIEVPNALEGMRLLKMVYGDRVLRVYR